MLGLCSTAKPEINQTTDLSPLDYGIIAGRRSDAITGALG